MEKENLEEKKIERYHPSIEEGLNDEQIKRRREEGLVNYDTSVPTKSIKKIFKDNLLTIFNLLNLGLAIAIISVQSYKNLLFLGIVICNTVISIVQEIHSKRMVDKLSIISAMEVDVIRNKKIEKVKINDIVLDDIIILNTGNQIVTDSVILEGEIEVNESFITGEPDNIYKKKGDIVLSGSYIISGKCKAKVEHIGNENYTSAISSGAKRIKKVNSEIMKALNTIIRIATTIIIPLCILLFMNQLRIPDNTIELAVVNTVAAVIGMIPEGLVLLVSTVLAVSVIRLSKKRVLVQQLYCIETLARVDTLCLDKTGTITEKQMKVDGIIPIEASKEEIELALCAIGNFSEDDNGTIEAIRWEYKNKLEGYEVENSIAFNSQKKWSGISFKNKGSYIIGSPEFILKEDINKYQDILEKYVADNRVILLAHSNHNFNRKELPDEIEVMGLVLINNKIREDAPQTIAYFKEQGVDIRIISGDNPVTVSKIAQKVGIDNYEKYIDATKLVTQEDIKEAVKKYYIFGRVTPTQKKEIVKALKEEGHTVAMTGDGVNDVLALQESDCSIVVASGSDAARNVAQLVLLDSNFSAMPQIVAEGRRTINNLERSATLFLSKTIYATILAILFLFITTPYPFIPVQLTLISVVTIGIPSFVLALEPNKERVKGKFLNNVIKRALPSSLMVILNIVVLIVCQHIMKLPIEVFSTLCVILTSVVGLILLKRLCTPFTVIRSVLFIGMVALFIFGIVIFKDLLSLATVTKEMLYVIIAATVASMCIFTLFEKLVSRILKGKTLLKI